MLDDLVAKDGANSEYGMDNMSAILIKFDKKKWFLYAISIIYLNLKIINKWMCTYMAFFTFLLFTKFIYSIVKGTLNYFILQKKWKSIEINSTKNHN